MQTPNDNYRHAVLSVSGGLVTESAWTVVCSTANVALLHPPCAIDDLPNTVQLDPANLEAHNLLHKDREELHAEARHSVAIGELYA